MRWHSEGDWIGDETGETVAYVSDHRNKQPWPFEKRKKIARMIAATPEVMDALGLLLYRIEYFGNIDPIRDEGPIEDARNALEKAFGGA